MTRDIEPRQLAEILNQRIGDRRLVLFLDYDGTLTAIVEHPELAVLDDDTRQVIDRLVRDHPVYVISGRELEDVRARIGVEGVHYVGSHGFQMLEKLPGIDQQSLDEAVVELGSAAGELEHWLDYIDGVVIERKRFSFALHYRMVDREDLNQINSAVLDVLERYGTLTSKKGKKVIEFLPDVPWDKGRCVEMLLSRLGDGDGVANFAVYVGDDITDEDVFRTLDREAALCVVVGAGQRGSEAEFRLNDPVAVRDFLAQLAARPESRPADGESELSRSGR